MKGICFLIDLVVLLVCFYVLDLCSVFYFDGVFEKKNFDWVLCCFEIQLDVDFEIVLLVLEDELVVVVKLEIFLLYVECSFMGYGQECGGV